MARALGSYPGCHWFKSNRRYHVASEEADSIPFPPPGFALWRKLHIGRRLLPLPHRSPLYRASMRRGDAAGQRLAGRHPDIWRVGQAAKTPPFHGGNTGSIPVRVTTLEEANSILLAPSLLQVRDVFRFCEERRTRGRNSLRKRGDGVSRARQRQYGGLAQLVRAHASHA